MKQKILLEVIEDYIERNGYSPTIRELAEILEQSHHPIQEKLFGLEEKGYISTVNGKARTIRVLKTVGMKHDNS